MFSLTPSVRKSPTRRASEMVINISQRTHVINETAERSLRSRKQHVKTLQSWRLLPCWLVQLLVSEITSLMYRCSLPVVLHLCSGRWQSFIDAIRVAVSKDLCNFTAIMLTTPCCQTLVQSRLSDRSLVDSKKFRLETSISDVTISSQLLKLIRSDLKTRQIIGVVLTVKD